MWWPCWCKDVPCPLHCTAWRKLLHVPRINIPAGYTCSSLPGQPKVCQLDLTSVVHQDVGAFDVTVQEVPLMTIGQALHCVHGVKCQYNKNRRPPLFAAWWKRWGPQWTSQGQNREDPRSDNNDTSFIDQLQETFGLRMICTMRSCSMKSKTR